FLRSRSDERRGRTFRPPVDGRPRAGVAFRSADTPVRSNRCPTKVRLLQIGSSAGLESPMKLAANDHNLAPADGWGQAPPAVTEAEGGGEMCDFDGAVLEMLEAAAEGLPELSEEDVGDLDPEALRDVERILEAPRRAEAERRTAEAPTGVVVL